MARKTKAELTAEREAFRNAEIAKARAAYPARFMAALERLHKLGGDVFVRNGVFNVRTLNDETFALQLEYDSVTDNELYDLEFVLNREEEQAAEAERMSRLRTEALNMLSPDHLNALKTLGF